MTVESVLPEPSRESVLAPVQVLRAIAAAMVVVAHCYLYVIPGGGQFHREVANLGTLGVAIFFIISGFIMYYTCRNQWFGSVLSAKDFFLRRLHRIVPLYWLLTTILIAIVVGTGHAIAGTDAALSYLFVPYGFDGNEFRPVLGVGWTLNFEMFFYLLFALALLLPKRFGLPAILAVLLAFSFAEVPSIEPLAALAQPIILLFGIGIGLGWIRDRTQLRISSSAILLIALWVLTPFAVAIDPADSKLTFLPAIWAMSLAWVVRAVFAKERDASSRFGLLLGDASYLLYLSHPIVTLVMGSLAIHAGLTSLPEKAGTAVLMFVCAVATAVIGHLVVEKRLQRWTAPIFGRGERLRIPATTVTSGQPVVPQHRAG